MFSTGPSILIVTMGHEFSGMSELKMGGLVYLLGICFFKADGWYFEKKILTKIPQFLIRLIHFRFHSVSSCYLALIRRYRRIVSLLRNFELFVSHRHIAFKFNDTTEVMILFKKT